MAAISGLVHELQDSWAGAVGARLTLTADPISLNTDRAVSWGDRQRADHQRLQIRLRARPNGEVRISLLKDGEQGLKRLSGTTAAA